MWPKVKLSTDWFHEQALKGPQFRGRHISIGPKTDRRETAATAAKEFLEPSDWRDGKFNYETIQLCSRTDYKIVLEFQKGRRERHRKDTTDPLHHRTWPSCGRFIEKSGHARLCCGGTWKGAILI